MLWIAVLALIAAFFVAAWQWGIQTPSIAELLVPVGVILAAVLLIFSLARRLTRMDSAPPRKW
jgi:EamA domain-containing membrane protein RarD